jgi:hypothetical protein
MFLPFDLRVSHRKQAVGEAMLIVGACGSVAANDKKELPPTVAAIRRDRLRDLTFP